jgi:hypothetical protein
MRLLIATFLLSTSIVLAQESMNDESILKLVKSGIGDDLIVSMVQNQPGKYSLSPDDVVRLKQAGISERILTAMAKKGTANKETSAEGVKIAVKTPVQLSLADALSSKDANAGDTFKLIVVKDVIVEGRVVISKGDSANGRIITSEKKSFATHNGKLEVAVDSVQAVDGHNVPLDGHLSVGGGGVGFGRTGKEAEIEKGRVVNAVVTAETEIAIKEQ